MRKAETLGECLRRKLAEREMSLRGLQRESGLGLGYLSRLSRDEVAQPSPRTLQRVARVLGPGDGTYGDLMRRAGYL